MSKLGISGIKAGVAPRITAKAHVSLDVEGNRKIEIAIHEGGITAPELGENKMNMVNLLGHENSHCELHCKKVAGNDGSSKLAFETTEATESGGAKRHLDTHLIQACHWSWEQTDTSWKVDELQKVGMFLTDFNQEDPYGSMVLRQKFEKKCKFRFGKIGNRPSENEIIWD